MGRQIGNYVKPPDVDKLHISIMRHRMSIIWLSEQLGISKSTLHYMFKHELKMRKVYGVAIRFMLKETPVGEGRNKRMSKAA